MLEDALAQLTELGLKARLSAPDASATADGRVTLERGGHAETFDVLVRAKLSPSSLPLITTRARPGSLVVTERVSPGLGQALVAHGYGYVDRSGNARILGERLFVHVEGRTPVRNSSREPASPFTAAALPVVLVLLARPRLLTEGGTQRRLAELSGASEPTVSRTLAGLRNQGALDPVTDALEDVSRLQRQWIDAYLGSNLRHAERRFRSDVGWPARFTTAMLNELQPDITASGELAARLAGYSIRPVTASFYVREGSAASLIKAGRLRKDPGGPISIQTRFWSEEIEPVPGIAPLPVVLADLLGIRDPRLDNLAAELIHDDSGLRRLA